MVDQERAKIPEGTRLMPEEERLETLRELEQSKKDLNKALEKLPVVLRTIAMERHKKDLEDKIDRVEKAIVTFNKSRVYVAY